MNRRTFLKTTGLTAASVLATGRPSVAQTQPFKIGMAATLWLQADAATDTYWKACTRTRLRGTSSSSGGVS